MRMRSRNVVCAPARSRPIAISGLLIRQAPAHVMNENRLERWLHLRQVQDGALEYLESPEHFADHVILDDHHPELHGSGRGWRVMEEGPDPRDPPTTVQVLSRRRVLEIAVRHLRMTVIL